MSERDPMYKIPTALGSLALVAALLTACGPTDGAETTTTVTATPTATSEAAQGLPDDSVVAPPATSESAPVTDDEFLDYLMIIVAEDEGIYLPEGMGAAYAQDVCDLLEKRYSLDEVIQIAMRDLPEMGLDSGEHAYLVGASIGGACPEYEYMVG